jgi:aspartate carbamoyltransferase regulatory subunit
MANPQANPLFKHFRQPAIYLKLPSQGRYYPVGTIDIGVTGDIPVYPMTVKDEITLKTPDALMNGQGLIDVVKSCCPNIKDPWLMPSIDMDAVFIAIRLASYGEGMDIKTTCPHCKAENEHTVDLRHLLGNINPVDFNQPKVIDGLTFKFKPQEYRNINRMNIINYEEQRLVDSVLQNDQMSEEEKLAKFNESFNKLKDLNISVVVNSIESITTEEGVVVSDPDQIAEYLDHTSRKNYDAVKDTAEELSNQVKLNDVELTCDECTKTYSNRLEFDQSNFFG